MANTTDSALSYPPMFPAPHEGMENEIQNQNIDTNRDLSENSDERLDIVVHEEIGRGLLRALSAQFVSPHEAVRELVDNALDHPLDQTVEIDVDLGADSLVLKGRPTIRVNKAHPAYAASNARFAIASAAIAEAVRAVGVEGGVDGYVAEADRVLARWAGDAAENDEAERDGS